MASCWSGLAAVVGCSCALAALVLLPSILVAFPRIYSLAWMLVAIGLASRLVPLIERNGRVFTAIRPGQFSGGRRGRGEPGSSHLGRRPIKQERENARPLPPPGSPNVLLVVMDTVAAGHLSLHGYNRATSTTLAELADRGIQFDSARAASSWTLPSHATMFTGRWLHELSVGWLTPLDQTHPTLAEFLGERGYATAGFVANTFYCGSSSGLARGFTHYHDFFFPELTALKKAVLVNRALDGFQTIVYFAEDWLESAGLLPYVERLWQVAGHRSQGGGGSQSRAPWLALQPHATGAAVFRLLELLRCSLSLSVAAGKDFIVSGSSPPRIISAS